MRAEGKSEANGGRKGEFKCYTCKEVGHFKIDCPKPLLDDTLCHYCFGKNHKMAKCNLRKKHETEREKKKDRVFKGMSNSELSHEVNDQSFDTNEYGS